MGRAHGVAYVSRPELFRRSDVVSLHVPLTPDTRHLIRHETLAELKPGVILLDVSRGALVDTTALIDGLQSGRLGGVGLDVYEEEEGIFFEDLSGQVLQDDELARLLTFPNVLITAHQAFLTREALADIARTPWPTSPPWPPDNRSWKAPCSPETGPDRRARALAARTPCWAPRRHRPGLRLPGNPRPWKRRRRARPAAQDEARG